MTDHAAVRRLVPFTSESVAEGHPDKVCDAVADAILDACLAEDPASRVACEVLAKDGHLVLAGEISSSAAAGREEEARARVAREALRDLGYDDPEEAFSADRVKIHDFVSAQSGEIGGAVIGSGDLTELGAGDQGHVFGYATDETPELLPLPLVLAHRLAAGLAAARRSGSEPWLRSDAKTQVTVLYDGDRPVRVDTVLVSLCHRPGVSGETRERFVRERIAPPALDGWNHPGIRWIVNPAGDWTLGGPAADAGVTGRKIIVDTYGGMARHGGGAFSGKDPSKVDRSGAYFARWAARQVVLAGIARRAEVQLAYAIGRAEPVSVRVETFGTGDEEAAIGLVESFDARPGAIVERFGLRRPIYRRTTAHGHFGKPGLPWEEGDVATRASGCEAVALAAE